MIEKFLKEAKESGSAENLTEKMSIVFEPLSNSKKTL
jgi:hypothetical protein